MTRLMPSRTRNPLRRPASTVASLLIATLGLGACTAILPEGPEQVIATPAAGKPLSKFQSEDAACRQYAAGKMPSDLKDASSTKLQQQYDTAYAQCMAAGGNQIQVVPIIYQYVYNDPWYDPFWGGPVFVAGGSFHHYHGSGSHHSHH